MLTSNHSTRCSTIPVQARKTCFAVCAVLVTLAAAAPSALADEENRPVAPWHSAGVALTAQLGASTTTDPGMPHFGGGGIAGVQAVGHFGPLELGLAGEYTLSSNLASWRTGGSGLAGVGMSIGPFYGEALFELGVHDYFGVGSSGALFNTNPGVDGSLPFAGARLNLTLPERGHSGAPRSVAGIGYFSLFVRQDLGENVVSYSYSNTGWFGDGTPTTAQSTAQLGGVFELGIAVGGGFDIR
jgi:hypothetical protein